MQYFYSARNNAFVIYGSPLLSEPDFSDAVEVQVEVFKEFFSSTKNGKERVAGPDGMPMWQDIVPYQPTDSELYEKELAQINNQYAIDKAELADAYLNAGLFDGPTEATKKAAIYAQLQTTNTKYYADLDALDEKYGV